MAPGFLLWWWVRAFFILARMWIWSKSPVVVGLSLAELWISGAQMLTNVACKRIKPVKENMCNTLRTIILTGETHFQVAQCTWHLGVTCSLTDVEGHLQWMCTRWTWACRPNDHVTRSFSWVYVLVAVQFSHTMTTSWRWLKEALVHHGTSCVLNTHLTLKAIETTIGSGRWRFRGSFEH